jgi:sugar phosphate isomerase/epimerase
MDDFFKQPSRFPLSLHQLTALDASPEDLIAIAGELGCAHVCLFTHVPERALGVYPLVTAEHVPMVAGLLERHGVGLCNLEVFPLDGSDMASFEAGLAVGQALGATRATAHIHDADHAVAVARFAAFSDLAARYGIAAGLEFNAFTAIKDVHAAAAIVREAARPNGSLVLDMLHLFRNGGNAGDAASVADITDYAQLSDGPLDMPDDARWHEAVRERMLPGDGKFALADTIRNLRPTTILEIEVPQTAARKAGITALERARRAVEASRRLIDAVPLQENAA